MVCSHVRGNSREGKNLPIADAGKVIRKSTGIGSCPLTSDSRKEIAELALDLPPVTRTVGWFICGSEPPCDVAQKIHLHMARVVQYFATLDKGR